MKVYIPFVFFILCLVSSIASQLDSSLQGAFRITNYILWPTLSALIVMTCRTRITRFFKLFGAALALSFIISLVFFISSEDYTIPSIFTNFATSFLIYFCASNIVNRKNVEYILYIYIILSTIFSAYIILNSASIYEFMNSDEYLYRAGKNSAGQIIGGCMLCIFLNYFSIRRPIMIVSVVVNFFALAYIQCRSAMVGLVVSLFYSFYKSKPKATITATLSGLALSPFTLFIPSVQDKIYHTLQLDKHLAGGTLDLDGLSSGRLHLIKRALSDFIETPLMGCGSYYIDCFYINILANFGILTGAMLIAFTLYRFLMNFKKANALPSSHDSFEISHLCVAMTIFYAIVSLFEALPPYGPGCAVIMFWIVTAFTDVEYGKTKA